MLNRRQEFDNDLLTGGALRRKGSGWTVGRFEEFAVLLDPYQEIPNNDTGCRRIIELAHFGRIRRNDRHTPQSEIPHDDLLNGDIGSQDGQIGDHDRFDVAALDLLEQRLESVPGQVVTLLAHILKPGEQLVSRCTGPSPDLFSLDERRNTVVRVGGFANVTDYAHLSPRRNRVINPSSVLVSSQHFM